LGQVNLGAANASGGEVLGLRWVREAGTGPLGVGDRHRGYHRLRPRSLPPPRRRGGV